MILRQSWLMAVKDLRLFLQDRFAVILAVGFPVMFILLFTFLFKGTTPTDQPLELVVATEEQPGGLSQQIINDLAGAKEIKIKPMSCQEAVDALNAKEINGFLDFPSDFSQAVYLGNKAALKVVAAADAASTRAALFSLARSVSSEINSTIVAVQSIVDLTAKQQAASGIAVDPLRLQSDVLARVLSGQAGAGTPIASFDVQKVGPAKEPPSSNWVVPGYLVMFVFFVSAVGAEAIVAERETQTLERLVASGTRSASILGGKFLSAFLRGSAQVIILWLAGIYLFNVDIGPSAAAVIIISVLTVVMAAAFGVMLATLVKTRRAAGAVAVTTSIALAPLGGCWWPLFITPVWMQFIAKVTPHAWATTGLDKLLVFGATFSDVVPEMLALLVFAAGFGIIALWRFRPQVS
ncbi:MAG: ABC transporter permease [Chloroflexi bacterium]|nr:ABC transporter permease [Chloroflexota bacterium]